MSDMREEPTTPAAQRIAGLDALRGLAALAVFVCHLAAYWWVLDLPERFVKFTQIGAHGVDVFIVLSGFVLMLPFTRADRTVDVRQFYGRRLWRILPAYWAALAFAAVFAMTPLWTLTVGSQATFWDLVVHTFGLQTVFIPTIGTINGSLWSVSLEMTLYLIFPLLVVLLHRIGGAALVLSSAALCAVVGLSGMAIGGVFGGFPSDPHTLPMRIVQFTMGMVLATIISKLDLRRLQSSRRHRFLALAATLAAGFIATLASTLEVPTAFTHTLWALSGATLVWLFSVLRPGRLLGAMDAAGRRAYSFYLIHQPITLLFGAVVTLLPGPGLLVLLYGGVICLAVTCVATEILYRTVERPSHRMAQRRFPKVYRESARTRT